MDEVVKLLEQMLELGKAHAWVPLASVAIGVLVRLVKSDSVVAWFPVNIPAQYRAWVAVGLGVISGVLESIVGGQSVAAAIVGGLISALTAISGHELIIEGARDGRELGEKKGGGGSGGPGYGDRTPPGYSTPMRALVFASVCCGLAVLPGCAMTRDVKTVIRDIVTEILTDAQDAKAVVDTLHNTTNVYFLIRPNADAQAKVEQVFADVNLAIDAAIRAGTGVNSAAAADYNAAFAEFRAAYEKLVLILKDIGIVSDLPEGKMAVGRKDKGINVVPVPRAARMK